jgi:uncharacterized membrane protein YbjE (DUF340 family)
MLNLPSLLIPLIAGILLGFFLQNKKRFNLSKINFAIIIVLIFSMGFMIGSNNELLASMYRIGFDSVIIVLLSVFFSAIFVKAIRKVVKLE